MSNPVGFVLLVWLCGLLAGFGLYGLYRAAGGRDVYATTSTLNLIGGVGLLVVAIATVLTR